MFEKRADRALVVVSHDMSFIRDVCDSAAIIHNSRLELCDSVDEAVAIYGAL